MGETIYQYSTGVRRLDEVLGGVHDGDNIVWQTDEAADYGYFVGAYAADAKRRGRKLIYFHFPYHQKLVAGGSNVERYEFNPGAGFEEFAYNILSVIERNGAGVQYVFDCISGLVGDWYSDRMLANFYMLACPLVLKMRAVAFFFLQRGQHTQLAVESIHQTAQVVLDVFKRGSQYYLLPIKVFERHSPTMYMLHRHADGDFLPENRSAVVAEILAETPQPWIDFNIDRRDVWTRRLIEARGACADIAAGRRGEQDFDELKSQLLRMIITRDEAIIGLCERNFTLGDIVDVAKRMIGSGLIGGKAAGMLLARIILRSEIGKWRPPLEAHDSFYVGADVFLSFIIQNDCWWGRRTLKMAGEQFAGAEDLQAKIMDGEFAEDIIEQFREMLNYFGQSPIIVRSSSLLEDAYGNAFSGKYESVFLANQGNPGQRLAAFVAAVKRVYASAVSRDALSYRLHRGLIGKEEQMGLLVQRVSGTNYGDFYLPHLAGVGYSFNPFVWNSKIDPAAGVLRLVFGLGTHAVDSVGDDYTRIVSINAPTLRPEMNFDAVRQHTQRKVDLIDLSGNTDTSWPFRKVAEAAGGELPLELFAVEDQGIIERARANNVENVFSWVLTFDKLLTGTNFIEDMRRIMKTLEKAYDYPVDIEFTANFLDGDDYRINILQCRPFQISRDIKEMDEPEKVPSANVVVSTQGPIIGQSVAKRVDRIIHVSPSAYGNLPMGERHSVARLIGDLTNSWKDSLNSMLIGPGRWGTTMPALGIPVTFAEIRHATVLCEVVAMHEGLTPDISLGTHFFNDLVEMGITYIAIYPGKDGYKVNEQIILDAPNLLASIVPGAAWLENCVRVVDTGKLRPNTKPIVHIDAVKQNGMLYLGRA